MSFHFFGVKFLPTNFIVDYESGDEKKIHNSGKLPLRSGYGDTVT